MCFNRSAFLVFFLFQLVSANGQFKASLTGTLQPDGMESIAMKLIFEVDEFGQLTGKSVTDPNGPNRTTTSIQGSYVDAILNIKERENIETASKENVANFCFINAENLEVDIKSSTAIVVGKFTGVLPDGSLCAKGTLKMVGTIEGVKSPKPSIKPVPSDGPGDASKEPAKSIIRKTVRPKKEILIAGDRESFNWDSDYCTMYVYDPFENDGDKIKIYLNGKLVGQTLDITNAKTRLEIKLQKGKNTLAIESIDEGSESPTTAKIILVDSGKLVILESRLMVGERAFVEFTH